MTPGERIKGCVTKENADIRYIRNPSKLGQLCDGDVLNWKPRELKAKKKKSIKLDFEILMVEIYVL